MRLGAPKRRALLQLAQRMETNLAAHRNEHGPPGVDPSHVATLLKYGRTHPKLGDLKAYLEALPRSALARYTAAAGPQLERACREAATMLQSVQGIVGEPEERAVEAFTYVLGIVAHTLRTRERAQEERGQRARGRGR